MVGGRAEDLCDKLLSSKYCSDLDDLIDLINNSLKSENYDCILVLGAGDLSEKLKKYFNYTHKKYK